jgi:Uma2 family endonuclease
LERFHGETFAMAGGTPAHAYIIATLGTLVRVGVRGGPCRSTSADQRVLLPNDDAAYPDLSVWCGKAEFRDGKTLTNPTVIVEVLSPSTEGWDRVGKLDLYRGIPTVRHVLLVEHACWHVTLLSRRDDGTWTFDAAGPGGSVHLSAIGLTLHVDEVYEGVVEVGGPARDARPPRDPREVAG